MVNELPRNLDKRIAVNPVLCLTDWAKAHFDPTRAVGSRRATESQLKLWLETGIKFPSHGVKQLVVKHLLPENVQVECPPVRPRVVGLMYDYDRKLGLVNPLKTVRSASLSHARVLPFDSRVIQSLLIDVCHLAFNNIDSFLPEALGFDFSCGLDEPCIGNSMDIAALLSAVDCLSHTQCGMFDAACAVVQPHAENRLVPVDRILPKLEAFVREYGQGSLLVVADKCEESREFTQYFSHVWRVSTLEDLSKHLSDNAVVRKSIREYRPKLDSEGILNLLDRIRFLQSSFRHSEIIDLCERLQSFEIEREVIRRNRIQLLQNHSDALRHSGRHADSLKVLRQLDELFRLANAVVSDNERLSNDTDKAAALFDACDFNEAYDQLEPWLTVHKDDYRRFSAQKRVELLNTAGRLLVMLQKSGWKELFLQSIAIQREIDVASVRRTETYLIDGLLRDQQLDEAEQYISKHESVKSASLSDAIHSRYRRSKLESAKCRREEFAGISAEEEDIFDCRYVYAFMLLAQAQQYGRSRPESIRMLEQSCLRLAKECPRNNDLSILRLIEIAAQLLLAAFREDKQDWNEAHVRLHDYVSRLSDAAQQYFAPSLAGLRNECDRMACERLLFFIPYL